MVDKAHKSRLVAIDMMIGLAMLFVVLGHMSIGDEPQWYRYGLHNWIYTFHMRLFLFLSAFLIRYTYKDVDSLKNYGLYIWRKFYKFFIPFLVVGLSVMSFSRHSFSLQTFFLSLISCPRCTEVSFLWYIYLLFGFYLVSPLFFRFPQWLQTLFCVATMFLPMIGADNRFCAFDYTQYAFFYCLGVLCAQWIEEIRSVKLLTWLILSLPFLAFSVWVFTQGIDIRFVFPQLGWWLLPVGVASLPAFYLVAMLLAKVPPLCRLFTLISRNCYWIYLFQMFIIWGCEYVIRILFPQEPFPFVLFMVVAALLAIAIPIAVAELLSHLFTKKAGPPLSRPAKNTSLK